jgi:hypothetical protein
MYVFDKELNNFRFYILVGHPMRRYQHQLLDSPVDRSSVLVASDRGDQHRAKRIYWENLAFHAADFNQKAKKV